MPVAHLILWLCYFVLLTGMKEKHSMFVEIVSSCVPHLVMIVRKGRYTTSFVVDIKITSCSVFWLFISTY